MCVCEYVCASVQTLITHVDHLFAAFIFTLLAQHVNLHVVGVGVGSVKINAANK